MKKHEDNYQIGMLVIATLMSVFFYHPFGVYGALIPFSLGIGKVVNDKVLFNAPVYSDLIYSTVGSVLGLLIVLLAKH